MNDGTSATETEMIPALVDHVNANFAMIGKYNHWSYRPNKRPFELIDRSLNLVAHVSF